MRYGALLLRLSHEHHSLVLRKRSAALVGDVVLALALFELDRGNVVVDVLPLPIGIVVRGSDVSMGELWTLEAILNDAQPAGDQVAG